MACIIEWKSTGQYRNVRNTFQANNGLTPVTSDLPDFKLFMKLSASSIDLASKKVYIPNICEPEFKILARYGK
jgi:hypothetical protein